MQEFFHNLYALESTASGVKPLRFPPDILRCYAQLGDWYANCSQCGCGVFIEFDTDRPVFEFDFTLRVKIADAGFDVWENGEPAQHLPVTGDRHFRYRRRCAQPSRVRIYLPDSAALTLRNPDFSGCLPVPDGDGPSIVFFGDSITQCAYFPQSGMAFPAIVQRSLNGKMLNLGVGAMRYEPDSLFRLPFEPDIVCVSYGCNDLNQAPTADLTEAFRKAEAYLQKLKAMYPRARLFANTPLRHPYCRSDPFFADKFTRYSLQARTLIPQAGYTLIDGLSLVGEERSLFADDEIHLSAAGSAQYARNLLSVLRTR